MSVKHTKSFSFSLFMALGTKSPFQKYLWCLSKIMDFFENHHKLIPTKANTAKTIIITTLEIRLKIPGNPEMVISSLIKTSGKRNNINEKTFMKRVL